MTTWDDSPTCIWPLGGGTLTDSYATDYDEGDGALHGDIRGGSCGVWGEDLYLRYDDWLCLSSGGAGDSAYVFFILDSGRRL